MVTIFRLVIGAVFVLLLLYLLLNQYCREPIFVFVFEGVLFVFAYASPAFALLFALPPKYTPLEQTTVFLSLEVIARSAGSHRNLSRKLVAFLYLLKNVLYFAAVREELFFLVVVGRCLHVVEVLNLD